jgi:outer membrane biosynthesis protein TonB
MNPVRTPRCRGFAFAGLLLAGVAAPAASAPAPPPPPVELSAEAVEMVGREAAQARQLAQARRQLQQARRDVDKARSGEEEWRMHQQIRVHEQRVQQFELRQRQQLPPRQVRELPVGQIKSYIARVRQRIELHGDRHVPEENGQGIHGAADVVFTLRADGTLASLQVLRSTPPGLAPHTAALLRSMEPFEPFPRGMAAKVDRISFNRSFVFEPGGEPRYILRSHPPPRQGAAPGG